MFSATARKVSQGLLVMVASINIACAVNPFYVQKQPLAPMPMEYYQWWKDAQKCSGLKGKMKDVAFYFSASPEFRVRWLNINGDTIRISAIGLHETVDKPFGAFLKRTRITIAQPYILTEGIVKHEMMHALIFQNRDSLGKEMDLENEHHPLIFGIKCPTLYNWRTYPMKVEVEKADH
jgi:hypothetical protein